ncbi:hypothetical protein [Sulfurospirillum sp. UCH001]|uniref:hypothetical protein n=1 Tax=Sulfurospirillum sp. UCH001 TaxID=1581011 RepID=UPI000833A8AF|nr:hypothetical protein [Sulfurospirillum sp. UCH001]
MIDQTLTTPPTAPSSNDIPTFRTRFDAFIAWIVTFVSQLTTVINEINSTASTINDKEESAVYAASAAIASANFQGTWTNQTTVIGQSWEFEGIIYRVLIAGNTSPTVSPLNWASIATASEALLTLINEKAPSSSPALTGTPTAPTPTPGDNSNKIATTAFVQEEGFLKNKALLAEYVVTGSAVTSIDFTGLDINTHKSYRVEISIANATANSSGLYCFINGDTNLTNYYRELVQFDGTTIGANRANNPQIITLQPSSSLSLTSNVQRGDNGYARAINFGNSSNGSSILKEDSTLVKTATVSNITQLTFTTSVVNAIAIGSKIRIYRGDV